MAGASSTTIVVNLTKTIVGAGMLALPFAYRAQGIVLASTTIILAAVATFAGAAVQAYSVGIVPKGDASFFTISKLTYPSLAILFDLAIAVKCFGVGVSYLVITGNLMPSIAAYFGADGDSIFLSRVFWLVLAMAIVGPLSYLRSLESLRYTSIVGLFSVTYLVAMVVGHFLAGDTIDQRGPVSVYKPLGVYEVFRSLPIIVFAYTCGHNVYSALNEAAFDSLSVSLKVIGTCLGLGGAIYLLVGLTGYLSFGVNVSDNIISMYPQSPLSTFGRVAIVVLVVLSFPLLSHPCRASICYILESIRHDPNRAPHEELALLHPTQERPITPLVTTKEHIVVTSLILIATFIIACSVESLELVLAIVGATGATAISFILPGIFAYALGSSDLENRLITLTPSQKTMMKYGGLALTVWGITVTIVCLGSTFASLN